jgi:hypothetical protein
MSADRTRRISETVLGPGDKEDSSIVLKIDVRWLDRRGYLLSAQVVTRQVETFSDGRKCTVESFWLFGSGSSKLIEAASRYNARRLEAIIPDPALIAQLTEGAKVAFNASQERTHSAGRV